MVKEGMERRRPDATTKQMIWEAVYWSMGLVCDLEESHRALDDVLPIIETSRNYLAAKGQAFLHAFSEAQRDVPLQTARALVLRQATCRFGQRPGAAEELAAVTVMDDLEALARRVVATADWSSLLAKPWRPG
jgi:hypothetical protein